MRFPAGVTEFSVLRNAQTECTAHPASDSVGTGEEAVKRPGREVDYLSSSLGNRTSWLVLIILMSDCSFVNCISTDQRDGAAACWTPEDSVVRFPAQARYFSVLLNVQTGSGAHPASSAVGTVVLLPRLTL